MYGQLESSLRDVGLKLPGNLDAMICAVMKAHHAEEDDETQQERWNAVLDTDWSSWKPFLDKDTFSKLEKSETVALQLTSFPFFGATLQLRGSGRAHGVWQGRLRRRCLEADG